MESRSTLPKFYANACKEKPNEYYDYEHYEIKWGKQEDYEIIKKIGRGKYSEVYQGINNKNDQKVVLKVLKPVKKNKIRREIKILDTLKEGPNIVKLLDVVRDPSSKMPCLVTEYIENDEYKTIASTFTDEDIRYYLYQVLIGLDYCHSKGIMHRDIKPHNLIINNKNKTLKIIDWGLAEFYLPDQEYNVRVASRYFKGPELLVDDVYYDYSLDIWSLGCMMAALIFKKDPFFQGTDNNDQLVKIAQVLGTDELYAYTKRYGLSISNEFFENGKKNIPKKHWSRFINQDNQRFCGEKAIDLLSKMLVYDHAERITPKEAMEHDYFKELHTAERAREAMKSGYI